TVESAQDIAEQNNSEIADKSVQNKNNNKITICHRKGNGGFVQLYINKNALNAHIAHGDINPDKDGDGYTAPFGEENPCGYGDASDCDDNNADVNPGAAENFEDGIDNNCNGVIGTCDIIEDYVPCTDCADGTFGDYRNPETRRCSTRKRRGYYHCTGTVEIHTD
ncbi:MAG: hypothetical protein HKP45_01975, partial [Winogradskyella sp.]|nr:hypothetical protein [Winogradskyella sp.]